MSVLAITWHPASKSTELEGEVYIDGSRVDAFGNKADARQGVARAGSGFCVARTCGQWESMGWAPLNYDFQDINPAELFAALIVLMNATGPVMLVSDSAFFIRVWKWA